VIYITITRLDLAGREMFITALDTASHDQIQGGIFSQSTHLILFMNIYLTENYEITNFVWAKAEHW
jgi:hypothetical protein